MTARIALRVVGGLMALGLIVLWVLFATDLIEQAGAEPPKALLILPTLFVGLAVWAGWGAVRGEPVILILAGGLSLFPTGVVLLLMPGIARWIGILHIGLIAVGVVLLRWGREGEASAA
jgi:hypothetical protein